MPLRRRERYSRRCPFCRIDQWEFALQLELLLFRGYCWPLPLLKSICPVTQPRAGVVGALRLNFTIVAASSTYCCPHRLLRPLPRSSVADHAAALVPFVVISPLAGSQI